MSGIVIQQLHKRYVLNGQKLEVLDGLSLSLEKGQVTVLLGRSGSGKTTLLRVLGGLESGDSGNVLIPSGEKICMVFQEPRLMPWLDTEQNIVFAADKEEMTAEQVSHIISLVGLKGFERAYPRQLSMGMQQRVSLARALAYHADWMLMDEPFSALDPFTRTDMQQELLRIQQLEKKSILIVTHSVDEALVLADRIMLLQKGKITSNYDLYGEKKTRDLLSQEMITWKRQILRDLETDT